jgi:hypothetical protein
MIVIWLSAVFDYYLISFMVNGFENVYTAALSSAISDVLAYAISGLIFKKLGVSKSYSLCFSISLVGGLGILLWGLGHQESPAFMLLVFIAKFGIASTFNLIYLTHIFVFPTLFCTTAMGLCSFFSKVMTIFAPMFAQIEQPTPMIGFTVLSGLAFSLSFFLKTDEKRRKHVKSAD